MSRVKHILTVKKIESLKKVGLHKDGGNLYLKVTATGSKSWVFRYVINSKRHFLGLGGFKEIGLTKAREEAERLKTLLSQGTDPLDDRKRIEDEKLLELAKLITFKQCADAFLNKHIHELKNKKHIQQWRHTLEDYAHPIIGSMPIAWIDTEHVMLCLTPIWLTKNETASRLRGRIEQVLAWATVSRYRTGENPARWRNHLDKLLAKPSKVQTIKHHEALDYKLIPEFMRDLQQQDGVGARCLEFTIMTAARTGEAIGATWAEINLTDKLWTVPANRMKAKKEHTVTLSDQCITLLHAMKAQQCSDYVFSGQSRQGNLSNAAMTSVLKRMGVKTKENPITVHGFRSTFSDWVTEQTNHPSDVREMCLAHTIQNKAEAAYRRGSIIEKRFILMNDWANYLHPAAHSAKVLPFKGVG
jgi:integrase